MQDAELQWWIQYMAHPTAKARMWATYGARYYPFFWPELQNLGKVVEIGSGPLPVVEVCKGELFACVDTLAKEYSQISSAVIYPSCGLLADGVWDTVLLLNVLDHSDDPQRLCNDAYHLLRNDGKVLVFVHLGHVDDKHILVEDVTEVTGWLVNMGFQMKREDVIPANYMEPYEAYAGVWVK